MLDFIGFCLKSPIENEKMVFYGTELPDFTRVSYTNKKSTSKGAYHKWCAILCAYRTKEYVDFKELIRKIELFENKEYI